MNSTELKDSIRERNSEKFQELVGEMKELDLSYYQLCDEDIEFIAGGLTNAKNLVKLKLYLNRITWVGAFFIGEMISKNSSIQDIDLGSNQLGDKGIEILFKYLEKTSIESLDLCSNGIRNIDFLLSMSNLKIEELILSDNKISNEGAKVISSVITKKCWNPIGLDISRCGISSGISDICTSLENDDMLLFLGLNANSINEKTARDLAEMLKKNKTLVRIDLNSTGLSSEYLDIIVNSGLLHNKSLRSLQMGCNGITDLSCLSKYFDGPNPSLMELNLGKNLISTKSILSFCESLSSNCKLVKLNLSCNEIGNDGIIHISRILQNKNCQIEELELSQCSVGDKGLFFLLRSLWSNSKLKKINLSNNRIAFEGLKNLVECVREGNEPLQEVNLQKNDDIYEEEIQELMKSVDEVKTSSVCSLRIHGKVYKI